MRGIETQVRKIRRQIFAEVSRIGILNPMTNH